MATFTVSNLNDSGAGSLRAAIEASNAGAPGEANTITFDGGLTGSDLLPRLRLLGTDGTVWGDKENVGPEDYLLYPHLPLGDYVIEVSDAGGGEGH